MGEDYADGSSVCVGTRNFIRLDFVDGMRWLGFWLIETGPSATKDRTVRTIGQKSQWEKSKRLCVSGSRSCQYVLFSSFFLPPQPMRFGTSWQSDLSRTNNSSGSLPSLS